MHSPQLLLFDVSSYQGEIDWTQIPDTISGAIIKVGSVGLYSGGNFNKVDPFFIKNQQGARQNKLLKGYYYYPLGFDPPEIEARRYVHAIGTIEDGESLWFDIEDRSGRITKGWARKFIQTVEAESGRICHIYTDLKWIRDNPWLEKFVVNDRKVWLGHHRKLKKSSLDSATPFGNIAMHQYSRWGRLAGVPARVDLNIFYGTEDDWRDLAKPLTKNIPALKTTKQANPGYQKRGSAIFVRNLVNHKERAINADTPFEASSTIKVPIVLFVLENMRKKRVDFDTKLVIKPEHWSEGSGIINWTKWGELSIFQLITCIAKYSDSTATNCLLEYFGGKTAFNRYIHDKGYTTRLNMGNLQFKDYEPEMPRVGTTTAREIASLAEQLFFHKAYAEQVQAAFKKISHPWYGYRISKRRLNSQRLFIKTGSMLMVGKYNDCVLNMTGIVVDKDASYSFAYLNRFRLGLYGTQIDLANTIQDITDEFKTHLNNLRALPTDI